MADGVPRYKVLPLPVVQKWAAKTLSSVQLREAIFWIDEKAKTIHIVDIFWKKTNAVSPADRLRANHRIRGLKAALARGEKLWH